VNTSYVFKQSLDTETNICSLAACFVPLLMMTFSFSSVGVTVNSVNVIVCIRMFYVGALADIKLENVNATNFISFILCYSFVLY